MRINRSSSPDGHRPTGARTTGRNKKFIRIGIIAVAVAAAIFALIYYSGVFLPGYTVWHEFSIDKSGEEGYTGPDLIELKNRKVTAYKDGRVIFTSPSLCRVSNMILADINEDGKDELLLLNYNLKEFGDVRPFWVKFDPPIWHQHLYIYEYRKEDNIIKPLWMASDIGMEASDFALHDERVIRMTDRYGRESDWMWISFGLRCVD